MEIVYFLESILKYNGSQTLLLKCCYNIKVITDQPFFEMGSNLGKQIQQQYPNVDQCNTTTHWNIDQNLVLIIWREEGLIQCNVQNDYMNIVCKSAQLWNHWHSWLIMFNSCKSNQ